MRNVLHSQRSLLGMLAGGLLAGLLAIPPVYAFDLSNTSIPRDAIISGGPSKDGIPALTDPAVISADHATFLQPQDRVLGVTIDGRARAYPIRILNWHEVVNDRLGGTSIVVTYCPLCGSGLVFRAEHDGQRWAFGVSGLLYNNNVLLYDRDTESLWSQLKMEAVAGPRTGERLEQLPVEHTTWAAWRSRHPTTDVLSLETGYDRDDSRDPYAGYETTPRIMFSLTHHDSRLPAKAWVVGVLIDSHAKAYPVDRLPGDRIIDDQVGDRAVRVRSDASARSVQVTGASGEVIPSVQAYWFAWAAFHPDTAIYGEQ